MCTIAPPPASAIHDAALHVARTAAIASTPKHAAQPSSLSITPKPDALLTSTWTAPSASFAPSRNASSAALSRMSQLAACTLPPSARSSPAVFSTPAAPRAQNAMLAPSRAKASASARPMPRLAPVTITPLPPRPRSMAPSRSGNEREGEGAGPCFPLPAKRAYNARMAGSSARPRPPEPDWPAASSRRVLFLLDAASRLEARLLEDWIARHQPDGRASFDAVRIPSSRRRRRRARLDPRLETLLASGDDPLLAPLRVLW